jgi:hypothetical protein
MVEFKKYEGSTAELTDLGTVKDLAGKGGKIGFLRKNYNDLSKRVVVVLTNKAGNSAVVPCSKQVSEMFRAKKLTIAQLAGLNVIETEDDKGELRQFVAMPPTGGVHEIAVEKINVAAIEAEALNPEELAW